MPEERRWISSDCAWTSISSSDCRLDARTALVPCHANPAANRILPRLLSPENAIQNDWDPGVENDDAILVENMPNIIKNENTEPKAEQAAPLAIIHQSAERPAFARPITPSTRPTSQAIPTKPKSPKPALIMGTMIQIEV